MEHESDYTRESNSGPDLKQWLPLYGIHQVRKDAEAGRPSVANMAYVSPAVYYGSIAYHAITAARVISGSVALALYGIFKLT